MRQVPGPINEVVRFTVLQRMEFRHRIVQSMHQEAHRLLCDVDKLTDVYGGCQSGQVCMLANSTAGL
jgi:hypothetical protein